VIDVAQGVRACGGFISVQYPLLPQLRYRFARTCSSLVAAISPHMSDRHFCTVKIEARNQVSPMKYRSNEVSWRVETIPGIGVLGATAIVATAADPMVFRSGHDFAAWIGLVPRQDSTGASRSSGGRGRRRVFPRAAEALDVGWCRCRRTPRRVRKSQRRYAAGRSRIAFLHRVHL
jgi:transposase